LQFASVEYLLFLALGALVYFALPGVRSRTVWLLSASYLFYFSLSATWTAVLLAITAVGYGCGLALERVGVAPEGGRVPPTARHVLASGIVLVAGTLFVFKYLAFAAGLGNSALDLLHTGGHFDVIKLALPVGISFWTFQTIAYLVDVAKGRLPAEKNLLRYALFIAFFPQVTAGPIARGKQLLTQLAEKHRFDYSQMRTGLLLMLWGFFKKLVVADPLALIVDKVYGAPHTYGARPLVLFAATLAFSIQIYCDFSGYTDIVRGSARLFGVDLLPNFNRPYFSASVKEFWRRWHMSLMGWFKDYIYIPLGGSRVSPARRRLNIFAVFFISGLWHGAGLTFIVWGLLNAAYQMVGEVLEPARDRMAAALGLSADGPIRRALATLTTFALITFAWIFFRAATLADAAYIIRSMVPLTWHRGDLNLIIHMAPSREHLYVTLAAIVVVFVYEWVSARFDVLGRVLAAPIVVRWIVYQAAILAVVIFGYYGSIYSAQSFAYFKF
jgi:D-alanyl-lipoteichoic acid acyltransferase DltB (MBOAT superfamily)